MTFTTVIHLQFGAKNLIKSLNFFHDYFDHYSDCKDIKIIIVENNPRSPIFLNNNLIHFPDLHIIRGDNTFREFSGWTSGLRYLRDALKITESNIIFSNDTMLEHRAIDKCLKKAFYTGFKSIFSMEIPAMTGEVDILQSNPPTLAFETKQYISTYLFALNLNAVKKIDTLVIPLNINDFFHEHHNQFSVFNGSELLNSNYIETVEFWLYKKSSQKKWYGHTQLSSINFMSMRSKAMSIVNEHHLSDEFLKKNIIMIDIKKFLKRNFFQKFVFLLKKNIYSLKWRLRRYSKALIK